jgi:hypothetical protein
VGSGECYRIHAIRSIVRAALAPRIAKRARRAMVTAHARAMADAHAIRITIRTALAPRIAKLARRAVATAPVLATGDAHAIRTIMAVIAARIAKLARRAVATAHAVAAGSAHATRITTLALVLHIAKRAQRAVATALAPHREHVNANRGIGMLILTLAVQRHAIQIATDHAADSALDGPTCPVVGAASVLPGCLGAAVKRQPQLSSTCSGHGTCTSQGRCFVHVLPVAARISRCLMQALGHSLKILRVCRGARTNSSRSGQVGSELSELA